MRTILINIYLGLFFFKFNESYLNDFRTKAQNGRVHVDMNFNLDMDMYVEKSTHDRGCEYRYGKGQVDVNTLTWKSMSWTKGHVGIDKAVDK